MITIDAYAKINLFLEVPRLRPDGYHELWTVFQSIGLSDTLHLESAPGDITLTCSHTELPLDKGNLVYRAAALLKETFQVPRGASLHLEKRIPIGAGLGGGSTDAAAALKGLNQLWELNASSEELEALGAKLGMDVPFCVKGGTVYAEGRGEILKERLPSPTAWIVLVYPNLFVSTKEVYQDIDRRPLESPREASAMREALNANNLEQIAAALYNRLEISSFALYPQLAAIKNQLQAMGCVGTLMSGSGSSIFGLCDSEMKARQIATQLTSQTDFWVQAIPLIAS